MAKRNTSDGGQSTSNKSKSVADAPTPPGAKRPKAVAVGPVKIGEHTFEGYVLEGPRRLLSGMTFVAALGGSSEHQHLGRYLARIPNAPAEIALRPNIEFDLPGGGVAHGYDAAFLVEVLKHYQAAFLSGKLRKNQEHLGKNACIVLAGLAGVGLEALIDEGTGYRAQIKQTEYQDRLTLFLRAEAAAWEKLFEDTLGAAIAKLYGYDYTPGRPPRFFQWVFAQIYRFAVGSDIFEEMRRRNPNPQAGDKLHQQLTPEARRMLTADLRMIECLAEQSRTPEEFWERMKARFHKEPFQFGFGF